MEREREREKKIIDKILHDIGVHLCVFNSWMSANEAERASERDACLSAWLIERVLARISKGVVPGRERNETKAAAAAAAAWSMGRVLSVGDQL